MDISEMMVFKRNRFAQRMIRIAAGCLKIGKPISSYGLKKTCLALGYGFFILFFPFHLHGQEAVDVEKIVEEVTAVQDEERSYDELYEYLYQLYANPINLNAATYEDFMSIYLLTDRQVNNLFRYRDQYGPFLSIYELQFIPGFDQSTIFRLLPFVKVEEVLPEQNVPFMKRISQAENQLWLFRTESTLEPKRGYVIADTVSELSERSYYAGSPIKYYTRMRASSRNDFSIGLTLEKDAGEKIGWHPLAKQYGADFCSGHVLLENQGRWKKLMVGDYNLQFGQGLLLGSGLSIGKGVETVLSISPKNSGLQPYTSVMEHGFFRGLGGTYTLPVHKNSIDVTAFYSNVNQDGTTWQDSSLYFSTFTSIGTSGYHRTAHEIETRKKIREQIIGTHILYNDAGNNFHAGLLYLQTMYNAYRQKSLELYNLYEFSGRQNYNAGGHFDYHAGGFSLFGEAAFSKSRGVGTVGGLTAYVSSTVQLAWLIRHYDPDFHAFYGNAFGENTRNINESGMYWGIKFNPLPKVRFAAYYDYFSFPWIRYRSEAPSQGYDYLVRMDHPLSRRTDLYLQFREENKAVNVDDIMQQVLPGIKRSLVLNFRHQLSETIKVRTRIQHSQYLLQAKTSRGFAIAQDITLDFGKLKADTRYAIFRTADEQTRQYMYENDVLYAFSIPAYTGVGVRSYLLLRYKINRHLYCWVRAARTRYYDRDQLGSGLETIEGNTRTDLKFQVMVKL